MNVPHLIDFLVTWPLLVFVGFVTIFTKRTISLTTIHEREHANGMQSNRIKLTCWYSLSSCVSLVLPSHWPSTADCKHWKWTGKRSHCQPSSGEGPSRGRTTVDGSQQPLSNKLTATRWIPWECACREARRRHASRWNWYFRSIWGFLPLPGTTNQCQRWSFDFPSTPATNIQQVENGPAKKTLALAKTTADEHIKDPQPSASQRSMVFDRCNILNRTWKGLGWKNTYHGNSVRSALTGRANWIPSPPRNTTFFSINGVIWNDSPQRFLLIMS